MKIEITKTPKIIGSSLLCRFTPKNTTKIAVTAAGRWRTTGRVDCKSPRYSNVGDLLLDVTNNGVDYSLEKLQVAYVLGSTVLRVSPSYGPTSGGTSVVVIGENFDSLSSSESTESTFMECRFGGEDAGTPASYINSTTVICQTPSIFQAMSVPVVLVFNNGVSISTSVANYTYVNTARVEKIEPMNAPIGQNGIDTQHLVL